MSPPALAATVLLLRPDPSGFSVFMVQRHGRSGFMPSMWVFPGGRVEETDATVPGHRAAGGARAAVRLDADPARARALLVAALRETFEEAGLWLGTGGLPDDVRAPLARGELALADLVEAHDATLDLDALHPWARWVTPEVERRRFDAAFFVAVAPPGPGAHDEHETVDSAWVRPADALAAGMERFPLAPPTWCVLADLARHARVDDVLAAAPARDLRPVQPVPRVEETGLVMLLPGADGHPEPARADLPRRLVLGARGWEPQG